MIFASYISYKIKMKFYIVDAFTETLFGGNPAGVVILSEGEDFPEDELCIKTARELRYSETAFVKSLGNHTFHTRYFTPAAEVDLCGHATIGTFHALLQSGVIKDQSTYRNKTAAGELSILISQGTILMDMATPKLIGEIKDVPALERLYQVMGLSYKEQVEGGLTLMPKLISTGLPDIMLPVLNREDLNKLNPDMDALSKLSQEYQVVGVHGFSADSKEINRRTIHVRNFAPLYDIDEESATGTSNGALTYYGYLEEFIRIGDETKFIQGEKMGRPSLIISKLTEENKKSLGSPKEKTCHIQIGGKGVILAQGEIHL